MTIFGVFLEISPDFITVTVPGVPQIDLLVGVRAGSSASLYRAGSTKGPHLMAYS